MLRLPQMSGAVSKRTVQFGRADQDRSLRKFKGGLIMKRKDPDIIIMITCIVFAMAAILGGII